MQYNYIHTVQDTVKNKGNKKGKGEQLNLQFVYYFFGELKRTEKKDDSGT
jgi:hypothetical protein